MTFCSLGIPTKNNADSIHLTVAQILNQTRQPDEIVICDDSDDGTFEILQNLLEDCEIKYKLIRQTSDGVAGAYNEILNVVSPSFDIFATIQTEFAVSDNWLESHIRQHIKNPNVDIINPGKHSRLCEPGSANYFHGRNFSIKRNTLHNVSGWDDNFLRGEDWDMHIRLATSGAISKSDPKVQHEIMQDYANIHSPVTISKYIRHPTSATFIKKYGMWYVWFHPVHVLHDLYTVVNILFIAIASVFTMYSSIYFIISLIVPSMLYIGIFTKLRGFDFDSSLLLLKKLYLTPISIMIAEIRLLQTNIFNYSGFDVNFELREKSLSNEKIRNIWRTISQFK